MADLWRSIPVDREIDVEFFIPTIPGSSGATVLTNDFFESAGGSSQIDLAVTESSDTFAGSVTLTVVVNLAVTELSDTFSGSATVALVVDLSVTESSDTFSGTVEVSASPLPVLGGAGDLSFWGDKKPTPRIPKELYTLQVDCEVLVTEASDTFYGSAAVGKLPAIPQVTQSSRRSRIKRQNLHLILEEV